MRAQLDGINIEYEIIGAGEPVLLIHGALMGDAFVPFNASDSLPCSLYISSFFRQRLLSYFFVAYLAAFSPAMRPELIAKPFVLPQRMYTSE